jgi:hypothetical protein
LSDGSVELVPLKGAVGDKGCRCVPHERVVPHGELERFEDPLLTTIKMEPEIWPVSVVVLARTPVVQMLRPLGLDDEADKA